MRKGLYILILAILFVGCSKKTDTTIIPPGKSSLLFPVQNEACTTGTAVSATQTTITFNWTADPNSESYDLIIKNLLTSSVSTQTVNTNQAQIVLLLNTAYSWYVVSKSVKISTTAQSDTWKFYVAGPGSVSHPPYPADALKPTYAQSISATGGTINLSWTGNDPDNDIASYDVYFGTSTVPVLFKTNITDQFINSVTVISGTTYYWKVVSRDALGNISDSGIYQFKVN